jgi:hypothetical protein
LKALVKNQVTPGTPKYGNCNFALLRELFPALLGQSISNLPDAQRAQASSNIYITYMNQHVFAPLVKAPTTSAATSAVVILVAIMLSPFPLMVAARTRNSCLGEKT